MMNGDAKSSFQMQEAFLESGSPDVGAGASAIEDAFMESCGPGVRAQLEALKFHRIYRPGQEILARGEETGFVGFVVSGVACLSKSLPDGRSQTVGMCFPSQFIGRPLRPVSSYDAVALTPLRLCLFARKRFDRLVRESRSLEGRVLEIMLDKLDEARDWLLLLGRKTALERVATFLVTMARREAAMRGAGAADGLVFDIGVTRSAVADYLGLTTESVSRHLSHLRREGVIEMAESRSIRIPSFAALVEAACEDDGEDR